ncbi:phosphatase PAP2 family protein [Bordetella holmesii]|uniref:PAP2 family protein n=2 Tax=Bordetella holmesii TaxID=35814 RepID=A0A158M269_9BORD|nr:phosphatase PAP2 family protein [Bordetella holmesii]AIT26855.1 PAP2 superfamily protein [Bordetella holmesii 44057]EWM42922.1 PAP2 superfamily protein [Bordetella holmesii 41130]EWM47440.1 PAP2 superfamily protein [Bordetella holmesii 35009]EWM51602.1 PAP2 superfamily protein [Bordetella holmesii 70147]AMD45790.1 acid phosphatase [Bordetella holmesii H558]
MKDVAIWVSIHPYYWFFCLPLLAALIAWMCWSALSGQPPGRRRSALYACLALIMAVVFVALAATVSLEGNLVAFDVALARALSMSLSTEFLWLLSWFTHLGDRTWLTVLAIVMILGLLMWQHWVLAAGAAAATAGGGILNWLLKHFFERARPDFSHGFSHATGFSFPSGHASASLAVYGFGCYLLLRLLPARWQGLCVAMTAALIVAIGLSRVLLQVHFLSDVVAGLAVSALWLALCVTLTERLQRRR